MVFVDSSPSFMLGDGSINDGYLLTDGVHLTKPAMNKLAKNLKLKIKDKVEGVCKNKHTPPTQTPSVNQQTAHSPTDNNEGWTEITRRKRRHYDNNHVQHHDNSSNQRYDTRQRSQHYNNYNLSSSENRCQFCAETGHTTSNVVMGNLSNVTHAYPLVTNPNVVTFIPVRTRQRRVAIYT